MLATVVGLAAACAGAVLFHALGVPLAYILGAMVGSALAANLVGPLALTRPMRRLGQLIVGTAVAAVLDGAVVAELARLAPVMLLAAVLANGVAVALAGPLAWLAGTDRTTALLAALPAGMAEMATLARELGGQDQIVALVHTLRVVLVVASLPFLLGLAGQILPPPAAAAPTPAALAGLGLVLLLGAAAAYGTARAGVLNPWIVLPMLTGLLVVLAGWTVPPMPLPLLVMAQILIGASLGDRIRVADLARMPRAALAALASGVVLIGTMVLLVAPLLALALGVERPVLMLALAPGGLGEMIAAAKALALAPATVAGFQFVRSLCTNMVAPLLIRRWAASSGRSS